MRTPRARLSAPAGAAATAALALALLGGCASGTDPGSSPEASGSTASDEPSASAATSTPAPTPDATDGATDATGATDQPTNGTTAILTPEPGATLTGPVTITGTATAFEATLVWEVVAAGASAPAQEGYTNAGANGEIGPFEIVLDLPAGTYTLAVWEPDMADGDAGADRRNVATVTFTVE